MFQHPELINTLFPKDPKVIAKAVSLSLLNNKEYKDVRFLKSLLARLTKVHPRLQRHIRRFKTLTTSAEWDIVPFDEKDKEKAEQAKRRISSIMQELIDVFIDGMLFGNSLIRIKYDDSSLGKIPVVDKKFHPTETEFNTDYLHNTAILLNAEMGKFKRFSIDESEKHLYIAYANPDNYEPGGLLRDVIYYIFMLNLSVQEWMQFQQFLKGVIQGRSKKAASEADKKAGEKAVQTAVDHNFAFTSDQIDIEFHKIADSNAGKSFDDFTQKMEEDIEIAITGTSSLASDRQRNAMTVQERDAQDISIWGRKNFQNFINKQMLKFDYRMNNSKFDKAELPYEFKFIQKLSQDKQINMNIIQSAVELGIPINLKEFTLKTGIEHAGKPNDLITNERSSEDNINGLGFM